MRYFPGSIGDYTIHMTATDSDMELSSPLELEWREEDFLLPAPPEMPIVQWNSPGSLEVVAPPLSNFLIDTAQGMLAVGPVM